VVTERQRRREEKARAAAGTGDSAFAAQGANYGSARLVREEHGGSEEDVKHTRRRSR